MTSGESGEIVQIRGGRGITRRLTDMGFVPGAFVRLVSDAGGPGPVLVKMNGTQIGIGRGMARRVLIRPT
jgi:ferrous iron transport protein A